MTRIKKNRSLKRIHKVKTGSASKLKRSAANDRQSSKRVKKRTPSVYEKFLAENPEAKEQQQHHSGNQQPKASPKPAEELKAKEKPNKARNDTPKSLLDQLDDVDFKDIY